MKIQPIHFSLSSTLLVMAFIAMILGAYCRGNYLFGMRAGIAYAIVTFWFIDHAVRALRQTAILKIVFLVLFVIPVAFVFAFPTYFSPNVQVFIDDQARDRNARAELNALFATDPAFGDLAISTIHVKCINVEVTGSVPTRQDMERLQSLVFDRCRFVDHCLVHWRIRVRDESKIYVARDDDAFQLAHD